MIRILVVLLVLAVGARLQAQTYEHVLRSVNEKRINTHKTSAQVLGAWAIGNIALGLTLRGGATGPPRYFHTMNVGWNVVNFSLATVSYIRFNQAGKRRYSLEETVKRSMNSQKLYLLNAGLDMAYVAGGLYLRERSTRSDNPDQLKGFGNSVILQGGFLFVYDLVLFYIHSRILRPAFKWMDKLQPAASGNGVGLQLQF